MEYQQVDFIAVLKQLRKDRARLIENKVQFKLALEILDEMLFGTQNLVEANSLLETLPQLTDSCRLIYPMLQRLPCSHTFETARQADMNLNRNPNILPADSRIVYPEVSWLNVQTLRTLIIVLQYLF